MFEIKTLTKRNIKVFLRDRVAVFFSFLSVIILMALYILFIGKQYQQGMEMVDAKLRTFLITSQMMGGVLIINTISLSLGIMGNIVNDIDQRLIEGFLVTPVKRYKIILSYFLSSVIVTVTLTMLMWVITILYIGISSGYWFNTLEILSVSGIITLSTFISASVMILVTTVIKSINAFGAVSGVLGTFIGFSTGIYMPLHILGTAMKHFASLLPFTHLAIILKRVMLARPLKLLYESMATVEQRDQIMAEVKNAYGYNEIGIVGQHVSMWIILTTFLVISMIFLFLALRKMIKRIQKT